MSQVVYFIKSEADGLIKIGTTSNLKRRFDALQTSNSGPLSILGVMDGGPDLEKKIHVEFDQLRRSGEWFLPKDILLSFIEDNAEQPKFTENVPTRCTCPHTIETERRIREVIRYRLQRGAAQNQISLIPVITSELGVAAGRIENILKGKTVGILVSEYEAVHELYVAAIQEETKFLEEMLAAAKARIAARDALAGLIDEAEKSSAAKADGA